MFVIANLISAVAEVIGVVLTMLYWLILIRAVVSWVNPDPLNPLVKFLYKTTEPVLYPIRKMLPATLDIGFDVSPIIAFLAILFLKVFLVRTLLDLSANFR